MSKTEAQVDDASNKKDFQNSTGVEILPSDGRDLASEHAERDIQDYADEQVHLQRRLSSRQITMMAIAGTIGTGLFLGSGRAVLNGGAVGAFLGYVVVSILICCMMMSLGEMSVHRPHGGSFVAMAGEYVDPALGFAVGWIYYISASILVPSELSACALLIQYWDPAENHAAAYMASFLVLYMMANIFGVRFYGETEFIFGSIKVVAVIALILVGLVINAGGGPNGDKIHFRYWSKFPFNDDYGDISNVNTARFLGFWAVLTQAAFSFGGVEGLGVIAGEAKSPQVTMKKAYKLVFIRIGLIYLFSIFVITLNIPRNDSKLLGASSALAQSPFVIMINRAGIAVLPAIINAVVITSALSAGNTGFYVGARMLVALARQNQAPKIFIRITKNGTPLYALTTQCLFGCLCFLTVSSGAAKVFLWLSNITTLCNMLVWWTCCLTFLRFYAASKAQNFDRRTLHFRGYFQPYLSWVALCGFSLIMIFNGFGTFLGGFRYQDFLAAYVTLPLFILFYLGWKITKRTSFVDPHTINLVPIDY